LFCIWEELSLSCRNSIFLVASGVRNGHRSATIAFCNVIPSEAEGSVFHGRKKQIPPLRCAPVGMTGFGDDAFAGTNPFRGCAGTMDVRRFEGFPEKKL
jgi:hypothetical protein